MNIALLSHDNKKELMVQFCIAYCGILSKHTVCATNTTGRLVAEATANGIATIASAIRCEGGNEAVNLQLAEKYIAEFGKLAKENNSMIIPGDLSNVAGFIQAASKVIDQVKK